MGRTEGNYVIFVRIVLTQRKCILCFVCLHKNETAEAAAAAAKEIRGMTQLTLYLSCVLITGHYTCRQHKISNCFYCCVSREITTKANNGYKLMSAPNVTLSNFRLIVIILTNIL